MTVAYGSVTIKYLLMASSFIGLLAYQWQGLIWGHNFPQSTKIRSSHKAWRSALAWRRGNVGITLPRFKSRIFASQLSSWHAKLCRNADQLKYLPRSSELLSTASKATATTGQRMLQRNSLKMITMRRRKVGPSTTHGWLSSSHW